MASSAMTLLKSSILLETYLDERQQLQALQAYDIVKQPAVDGQNTTRQVLSQTMWWRSSACAVATSTISNARTHAQATA